MEDALLGATVQAKSFLALCRFCGDVIWVVEPRGKSGTCLGPKTASSEFLPWFGRAHGTIENQERES